MKLDFSGEATKLPQNDSNAIKYQATTISLPLPVLEFGLPYVITAKEAKFKNPKKEILKVQNIHCHKNYAKYF